MLSQQQAQHQLDSIKLQEGKGQARMVERLLGLSPPLRDIGLHWYGLDKAGHPLNSKTRELAVAEAIQKFGALTEEQRAQLFDAWFGPRLGQYAYHAYILDKPYQVGYKRKAFRAGEFARLQQLTGWSWLRNALNLTHEYDQPLSWFAQYAGYLGYRSDALGWLFAAAIDLGDAEGDAVFEILKATANGTHPIGVMGRHITRGLLAASKPEGWACIEQLLMAAQRQEGLRQVILESVDECHPDAFKRMLRLILDHKLTRFSATLRAFDVWLGYQFQVESAKRAERVISQLLHWLEHDNERNAMIRNAQASPEPEQLYLALWASAYFDALKVVHVAADWLCHDKVELRLVALHLLDQLELYEITEPLLIDCLGDDDLRVCARAFRAFSQWRVSPHTTSEQLQFFEKLTALLARVPSDKTFAPMVWPWMNLELNQQAIADMLVPALGERSAKQLVPYLHLMSAHRRSKTAELLAKQKPWDAETRRILFKLLSDPSGSTRKRVVELFTDEANPLTEEEMRTVENLLKRKSDDLRRAAIALLLRQPAERARASATRLAAASNTDQRAAGLEMLKILDAHAAQLPAVSLKDALGLINPLDCTPVIAPQMRNVTILTPAAVECLKSLDALIDEHGQTLIRIPRRNWSEPSETNDADPVEEKPLADAAWLFPRPDVTRTAQQDINRLPLAELWESWWHNRSQTMRDDDGLELVRAALLLGSPVVKGNYDGWYDQRPLPERDAIIKAIVDLGDQSKLKFKHTSLIERIVHWLVRLHPTPSQADFVLDVAEHSLALVHRAGVWDPERIPRDVDRSKMANKHEANSTNVVESLESDALEEESDDDEDDNYAESLRDDSQLQSWLNMASRAPKFIVDWKPAHDLRLWRLFHWTDKPYPSVKRHHPPFELVLKAWSAGEATEADVIDQLLGDRPSEYYYGKDFFDLRTLSGRRPHEFFKTYPKLHELVERCKARILEIELARGELPTAATAAALCIRSLEGADVLLQLLVALGDRDLVRGDVRYERGKSQVLSHLIRVCTPSSTDTPEAFADRCKALGISETRLVELGVFAPQWARFVECALEWPGAAEAIWWLHAHTKERGWHVDQEVREIWQAEISEHTPLKPDDLLDGAVDVAWFWRAYGMLGAERWEAIYESAKLASSGIGHTRARLFADAMLGKLEEAELIKRIQIKRHQDSVRALGLLPIATNRAQDDVNQIVLARYKVLQEFLHSAKQFGSQRQASEKLAVRIGLHNLARTAGYPDPVRLEWAMEIQAFRDLADGPVIIHAGDAIARLSINAVGEAKLDVEKRGRPVKTVPQALKKLPAFIELKERQRELTKQAVRMRESLEQAMVRGEVFEVSELRTLFAHPILRVMLEQLVFITIDGAQLGYLTKSMGLLDQAGNLAALKKNHKLRIAHPIDLLNTKEWHLWQQECYRNERIQPFKQVFRELYVPTRDELDAGYHSRRYAGHQVNPRQAAALLGTRGWVMRVEDGGATRTFHDVGIVAWIDTRSSFLTPAEVEPATIETVHFAQRGDSKPLPLAQVPLRIFSEVMRDIDLVVSVAHVGGVDPEASASTIELRAALLREASRLLKFDNVVIEANYALITGKLNRYSVHLGSGVVHQQPGGHLCIVPVHSQHRGRLFLPFMDNDPCSAEVLSKVLLLARDEEIKDPSILEQITRVR